MENVKVLLKRFFSVTLAFVLAFLPFTGGTGQKVSGEVRMKAAIVSDVHIDRRFPLGQLALKNFYRDANAFAPDAAVVLGDLTNYGDKASMAQFFALTKASLDAAVTPVIISGNHDIGHAKEADGARMNGEALADFMQLYEEAYGQGITAPAYLIEVNGYPFICLNDESADNWDRPEYSAQTLRFLEETLNRYDGLGKPIFVLMHVPLSGVHGEENFYPDGAAEEPWSSQIRAILQQHENVFCLSGHLHKGLSNNPKTPTYTRIHGVHYLNLPSYLMPNWPTDLAVNGLGFILEVTDSTVLFRCRNYYGHNWYANYDYEITLAPAA